MYHQVRSRNLAIYLYEMGFKDLEEIDHHGRTPLMRLASRWGLSYSFDSLPTPIHHGTLVEELNLVEWFLSHGADPLRLLRDHDISLLHVTAFYGTIRILKPDSQEYLRQWIDPGILKMAQVYKEFDKELLILRPSLLPLVKTIKSTRHDGCRCKCSTNGCTPITAFLKGIAAQVMKYIKLDYLKYNEMTSVLYYWYVITAAEGLSSYDIREELRRFVAFSKLELTHTCCQIKCGLALNFFECKVFSDETTNKIHEDEKELLAQLEKNVTAA